MDSLSKDLVLIVLQFLQEEKYKETVQTLEKESGLFFNMRYFEEKVHACEWDEAEKYLSAFTKVDDNKYSMRIYFELRKQKYLEALDRKDKHRALDILLCDLKDFSTLYADLYSQLTQLLRLDDFRQNEQLKKYGDLNEARMSMMVEVKKLMKANPLTTDKLAFPIVKSSRLRTLINQSLQWQHQFCRNQRPTPDIRTLFTDHSCGIPLGPFATPPVNFPAPAGAMPATYVPLGIHTPFPVAANPTALAGWLSNAITASSVQPAVVPASNLIPIQVSGMKHPIRPPVTQGMFEYPSLVHERFLKRPRTAQPIEEVMEESNSILRLTSADADGGLPNEGDVVGKNKEILNPVDDVDTTKARKLTEITDSIQFRLLTLYASEAGHKVSGLLYTSSGTGILVLGSNGLQKLWKWVRDEQNPSGKATAKVDPLLWQPISGLSMANDIAGVNLQEACPCIALTKNDSYVMSACGGKVTLFNMVTYRVLSTFMSPPPVSTSLAFHPHNYNTVAVGMDDSIIYIYDVRVDKVNSVLKGHQKRVTGLAFSTCLNILISSGADAHICIWSIDTWNKIKSCPLQLPSGKSPIGDTRVEFHSDQIRFLVSHATQLAMYDGINAGRIQQWIPQDILSAPISYAALSCDSLLVYASFSDGNVGVFDADSLKIRYHLSPSVYLTQAIQGSSAVYPVVVATNPEDPYQFALGLTDGSVKIIQPFEPEGMCGGSESANQGCKK